MSKPLALVDTSYLYATYDASDSHHEDAIFVPDVYAVDFVVPQVVLTETAYLLKSSGGVRLAARFISEFARTNPRLEAVTASDLLRASEIMLEYEEAKFDFVDCCLMALSERLNITMVCTFDERDFSIFRPKHIEQLERLP